MKNIREKRRKEKIETYLKYFYLFFFLIIYSYRYFIQISIEFRFKFRFKFKFIELQKFIEFEVEDIRNIFFKKYIFWK